MRRQGLEKDPIPQMFEPLAQNPSRRATIVLRTSGNDPLTITGSVREAVRHVDERALVYGAKTLEEGLDSFLAQRRLQTWLLAGFAAAALLIAAIGIYGLIQYSVSARKKEIGIRIAVGAQRGAILRMILGEGLRLVLAGMAFGVAGALALTRLVSSLLFGVGASDPLTFVPVMVLLGAVAVAACYFPARRAMKADPVAALRQD
jgi:ABC-type lipoprotein release transport system permease subunit